MCVCVSFFIFIFIFRRNIGNWKFQAGGFASGWVVCKEDFLIFSIGEGAYDRARAVFSDNLTSAIPCCTESVYGAGGGSVVVFEMIACARIVVSRVAFLSPVAPPYQNCRVVYEVEGFPCMSWSHFFCVVEVGF